MGNRLGTMIFNTGLALVMFIAVAFTLDMVVRSTRIITLNEHLQALVDEGYTAYASSTGDFHVTTGDLYADQDFYTSLSEGSIPYIGTSGLLTESANLTYNATGNFIESPTGRTATYVIAASDAPAHVKAQADKVCNGINDHLDILEANDALTLIGGGIIQLTQGTYNVTGADNVDKINISSNITLQGIGWATIINITTGGGEGIRIGDKPLDAAPITRENIIIRDLKIIDEAGATSNGIGIGINNVACADSTFRNILIENVCADGINKEVVASHTIATTVAEFSNVTYRHLISTNGGRNGISTDISVGATYAIAKDLFIEDCYIDTPANDGIIVTGNFTNVNIKDCTVITPGGHGIYIGDSNSLSINDVTISGNKIYGVTTLNKAHIYALGFDNLVIGSNTLVGTKNGIQLDNGSIANSDTSTIQGNIVSVTGAGADAIEVNTNVLNTIIIGNELTSDDGYPVYLSAGNTAIVSSNTLYPGVGYNAVRTNGAVVIGTGNIASGGVIFQASTSGLFVNNKGYIMPGELRTASGTLTAGNANAIAFYWENPEAQDIYIKKVVITVTTVGGTAGAGLQVGIADDAAGTNIGTEFANTFDLNTAAVYDSCYATDNGTQVKWVFCQDSASATDGWVVGKILVANAASLGGSYYIEYVGR